MFAGFTATTIDTGAVRFALRHAGAGPALLLLHGYPQCHLAWHAVAPLLVDEFTVVVPDLPGYGASRGRGPDAEHRHHSKRTMAADLVALMTALGHTRFGVAGHDRGGRVGYRMALDRPAEVSRLCAVDLVPTFDMWKNMDGSAALRAFHWLFLAQPAPFPEQLLAAAPDAFLDRLLASWAGRGATLDPAAVAEYRRHHHEPDVITAMCEDYRAGATVDRDDDRADREAGRRIACPVLALWGRQYLGKSPLETWRVWADDVREVALDCGHFIAEEQPEACAAALREFFR